MWIDHRIVSGAKGDKQVRHTLCACIYMTFKIGQKRNYLQIYLWMKLWRQTRKYMKDRRVSVRGKLWLGTAVGKFSGASFVIMSWFGYVFYRCSFYSHSLGSPCMCYSIQYIFCIFITLQQYELGEKKGKRSHIV